MKITIVSGARPNFMKIAPICRAIQNAGANGKNISYRLVYAGPEDDPSLEESLFFDLGMENPMHIWESADRIIPRLLQPSCLPSKRNWTIIRRKWYW